MERRGTFSKDTASKVEREAEKLHPDHLLPVPSNQVYRDLQRALAHGSFDEDIGGWPSRTVKGKSLLALAQLRPDPRNALPDELLEALRNEMERVRDSLSDTDVDVLDAVNAMWIERAQSAMDTVTITADDILRMRGIKAHLSGQGRRGGYPDDRRQEIAAAIERLRNVWLKVAAAPVVRERRDRRGSLRRVKETWSVESPALVISSRILRDQAGKPKPFAWHVRPGDFFAAYLLGPGRQVALLSREALRFDPYRQSWEKRLARFLAYQWRVRARRRTFSRPFRVRTLLQECDPDFEQRRPGWLRRRLEKALDELKGHGVIAGWCYCKAECSKAHEDAEGDEPRRRGWFSDWLISSIAIQSPATLVGRYSGLGDSRGLDSAHRTQASSEKTGPAGSGQPARQVSMRRRERIP